MLLRKFFRRRFRRYTPVIPGDTFPRHVAGEAPPDEAIRLYPASFSQESRLLTEELARQVGRSVPSNQFPIAIRMNGRLNRDALVRAVQAIVVRHAGLRTAFVPVDRYSVWDRRLMLSVFARRGIFVPGLYGQAIRERVETDIEWKTVPVGADDLTAAMENVALAEAAVPLNLDSAPPMRMTVFRFSEETHLLVVVSSHTAVDGWSAALIRRELGNLYIAHDSGSACQLAGVHAHGYDFALWERQSMSSGAFDPAIRYWQERWAAGAVSFVTRSELPPWLVDDREHAIRSITVHIDAADSAHVRDLAAACATSPYVILRSLFTLVLHACANKTKVTLWANFANRRMPGADQLVGNCATQHAITSELLGHESLETFVRQVDSALRMAQQHEAVSLAAVRMFLDRTPPAGDTWIMFDLWPPSAPLSPDERIVPLPVPAGRQWVDLDVRVRDDRGRGGGWSIITTFDSGRYSPGGVAELLRMFCDAVRQSTHGRTRPALELANATCRSPRNVSAPPTLAAMSD